MKGPVSPCPLLEKAAPENGWYIHVPCTTATGRKSDRFDMQIFRVLLDAVSEEESAHLTPDDGLGASISAMSVKAK